MMNVIANTVKQSHQTDSHGFHPRYDVQVTIDVSSLEKGIYFVSIKNKRNSFTKKIIVD